MKKPVKLFGTLDRAASHAKLEEVRAAAYPDAECREDANNEEEPFQVWSGPDPRSRR